MTKLKDLKVNLKKNILVQEQKEKFPSICNTVKKMVKLVLPKRKKLLDIQKNEIKKK